MGIDRPKKSLPPLNLAALKQEARNYANNLSQKKEPHLFGLTDGKAVGTYIERGFKAYLEERYNFLAGSASKGIDFPDQGVDVKATSIKQPQSSCPFESTEQKIFGLGYSLLLFIYDKQDDIKSKSSQITILHSLYVDKKHTADFQTTQAVRKTVDNAGNEDDLMACLADRNLPIDSIAAKQLAQKILNSKPEQGLLTISNALQWRLQYGRLINSSPNLKGLEVL